MSGPESLASLLRAAERILAFTGAGVSTGSGIPDFRGPGGVWTRRRPVYYREFLASEEKRVEHWDYKLEGRDAFRDARPNAAHLALAELEKAGKLLLLVTQNIDGLHQKAGHAADRVVELHGTNARVHCAACGAEADTEEAFESFRRGRRCPRCPCGGPLKTATVMFGQPMPVDPMRRALDAARRCDLMLAVGSTLEVEPAASVPLSRGAAVPYAVVNRGPTAHDSLATLRLEGDAAELLPAAVALALG